MKQPAFIGAQLLLRSKPNLKPILIFSLMFLIFGSGALLTACGSKRTAFDGKGSPSYTKSGPIPKGGGRYKVGSRYKILHSWYTPRENTSYDKVGTASWYGPKFHRRLTANGEWFDMNQMTAAHKTLPLPVIARVTNLKNGRTIIVRINDRGPYAHNREIDLSRAAARKLGFIRQGTAKVRVQYLRRAPLSAHAANYYGQQGRRTRYADMQKPQRSRKQNMARVLTVVPQERQVGPNRRKAAYVQRSYGPHKRNVSGPSYPGAARPRTVAVQQHDLTPVVSARSMYVQAASYSNFDNAMRAKSNLSSIGRVRLDRVKVGRRSIYRVRVGPLSNRQAANRTLSRIVDAGHRDARIIGR